MELTQSYLKEALNYEPKTGIFVWNHRPINHFKNYHGYKIWNTKFEGKIAGTIIQQGYIRISISGRTYRAHRLAWLYTNGEWPKHDLDHINHLAADNRISNLRCVSHQENMKNARRSNKNNSGFTGVSWFKKQACWKASIIVGGNSIFLGYYKSIDMAIEAREKANFRYGFHSNHGKQIKNKSTAIDG